MMSIMTHDWKPIIKQFRHELDEEERFFSIKDLCDSFLTNDAFSPYWKNKSTTVVVKYIRDCIERTQADIQFRENWIDMPNMQNILEYDRKEIMKLEELISRLS